MNEVIDILRDVGRVIADALDILRGKQQMGAEPDGAGILHHIGQELAEDRIVERIDFLVRTPHFEGPRCILAGIGVEHVLQLLLCERAHPLEPGDDLARQAVGHRMGALRQVLGQIADPLEIGGDPDRRHHLAQIARHRLPLGDGGHRALLDRQLQRIDLGVVGYHQVGELRIALRQGGHRPRQL